MEAKVGWEKSWEAIVVLAANVQNGKRVGGLCQSGIWRAANISDPRKGAQVHANVWTDASPMAVKGQKIHVINY